MKVEVHRQTFMISYLNLNIKVKKATNQTYQINENKNLLKNTFFLKKKNPINKKKIHPKKMLIKKILKFGDKFGQKRKF